MRRRSGFTLVEVLVSMALILFIMSILSAAFVAATQSVSDLKSAGDLAEKLHGAVNVLRRDLEQDHFTDSSQVSPLLSQLWTTPAARRRRQLGFFRIYEGAAAVDEGADLDGIHSFSQTTAACTSPSPYTEASAAISCRRSSTRRPIPRPCSVRTTRSSARRTNAIKIRRISIARNSARSPSSSCRPSTRRTTARNCRPLPAAVPVRPDHLADGGDAHAGHGAGSQAPNYFENSTVPSAGEASAAVNLSFNAMADLTMPVKRFWMDRTQIQGATSPPRTRPGFATSRSGKSTPASRPPTCC